MTIYTVGHSTRPIEDFIALLAAHGVGQLIDIRTIPRSRTNPQFNRDTLPKTLERAGMAYGNMPALGGLRRARPDSPNTAWRNPSFRGYADYMQTSEFAEAVAQLIEIAQGKQTAIMCAEAVPWRCHRSLIADALIVRGIEVREITSGIRSTPHALTPWAQVSGTRLSYPAGQATTD